MYKNWMTSEVKLEITASIARVVVHAADRDADGKRMSGAEMKELAEAAGEAILAGLVKAGIAEAGDDEGNTRCVLCGGAGEWRPAYSPSREPCPKCAQS